MSITRSYNRKLNRTYVYDTSYEWSEERQRKIQKRKCIGQVDPQTGEVIPNGKVGRRPVSDVEKQQISINRAKDTKKAEFSTGSEVKRLRTGLSEASKSLQDIEHLLQKIAQALSRLREGLDKAVDQKAPE